MFFRKRRPNPMPIPPWMRWGIFIFLLIIMLFQPKVQLPPGEGEVTPQEVSLDKLAAKLDLTAYKAVFSFHDDPKITELKRGNGPLLVCGQEVEVKYLAHFVADTAKIPEKEPVSLRFRVGNSNAPLTLQRAITGMYSGGIRELAFKPYATVEEIGIHAPGHEGERVDTLNLELVSTAPDMSSLLRFDPAALGLRLQHVQAGIAPSALCGDMATIHLTLWDAEGGKLFDTREGEVLKPLNIHIGSGAIPLGIEQSVIGMQTGSKRSVIIPPAWQKPLWDINNPLDQADASLHKLGFPRANVIIADIELVKTDILASP